VTANVQDQFVNFVVLDTESRRMIFYRVEPGKWTIPDPVAGAGRDLVRDFQHKAP
jgi:hypothetical protein